MDEHDDRHQGPAGEPPPLRSGRVRIVGAEPVRSVGDPDDTAGGAAGQPVGEADRVSPPEAEEGLDGFGEASLPHWTDAPTGEVPAVLARATGDDDQGRDPWAALPSPTWREEHTDWQAGEETFEPSMLAQDELRIGALDDSGFSDRQPWSFELDEDEPELGSGSSDQDTVVVPAVRVIGEPGAGGPEDVPRDAWPRGTPPTGAGPRPLSLRDRLAAEGPRGVEAAGSRADEGTSTDVGRGSFDEAGEPAGRGPGETGPAGGAAGLGEIETEEADDALRPRRATRRGRPSAPRSARPPVGRPGGPPPAASTRRPPRPRTGSPGGAVNGTGTGARTAPPPSARTGRDLPLAIVTGLVLGALALICFKIGTVASLFVVTVVVTLAAVEALAALRRGGYQPATLLGLVAVVSVMVATYNKGQVAVPLVTVLLVAFVVLWHLAGVERGADPVRSTASTLLVFCWIGVFGSYGALLLDPSLFPARHGIAFLLGAVVAAVACDVGALAVGATMGSHPLAPSVSPNKTWEGVIGGLVASVLASVVVVHFIHPWTAPKAAVLGVVVAIVSPIGDLTESLVKRHLGLKDMGRLLPGHGGILDRVDGLLFVLPATYYLVKALHLG